MSTDMSPFGHPIYDCNAALGRRHDRRVEAGEPATLMNLMTAAQISRAIVYNPYGIHFGTSEGNRFLLDDIGRNSALIPQFVVNLAIESPSDVADIEQASSVRIFPATHRYPLAPWVLDSWFAWLGQEKKPVYIPMGRQPEAPLDDVYTIAKRHPDVPIVLANASYNNYSSIVPFLKALPQAYLDLSRFDLMHGVERMIGIIGHERLLFGSDTPEADPRPYLYYLRECRLSTSELSAICGGNLARLMGWR